MWPKSQKTHSWNNSQLKTLMFDLALFLLISSITTSTSKLRPEGVTEMDTYYYKHINITL